MSTRVLSGTVMPICSAMYFAGLADELRIGQPLRRHQDGRELVGVGGREEVRALPDELAFHFVGDGALRRRPSWATSRARRCRTTCP